MRLLTVAFFGLLTACTSQTNSNNEADSVTETSIAFKLSDLTGTWHMLTLEENEWVLFYACDADNTTVTIKGDSLFIGWGQDATGGKIESWSVNNDKISLVVNDSYQTNVYQALRSEDGLMQWWLWEDTEEPAYFIHERDKSSYPTIKQPCKECWEDCDEDEVN